MIVIYLGPPGSGKGTQAEYLSRHLQIPHIATGDMLRVAVQKDNSLGRKAKEYIKQGTLVPDEIMIGIIADRIKQADCRQGFILDGFPRTVEQAKVLDRLLMGIDRQMDKIVNLEVPDSVLIERLSGRRVCKSCGANFHLKYSLPRKPLVCDHCKGELYQREDDKPETINRRLKVYQQQTAPLIDYYQDRLVNIQGDQTIEQIFRKILVNLGLTE